MSKQLRVTVWNEFNIEPNKEHVRKLYPEGLHGALRDAFTDAGHTVHTATFAEPAHGLGEQILAETDVLTWWAHDLHDQVDDGLVNTIYERVVDGGMGLILLHSSHYSKIFKKILGSTGRLKWRKKDSGVDTERLWVIEPGHPIAAGIDEMIEMPEEMYGERFDIPAPDELVFVSWFTGGEVFRSGCCWRRGRGRVFYFRPGHEEYSTYNRPDIRRILVNAVEWAAPVDGPMPKYGGSIPRPPMVEE